MTTTSLFALKPSQFALIAPLFAALDHHLAVHAVIAGAVPGAVYVDDPRQPRSALLRSSRRFHLGGDPHNEAFNDGLRRLFDEEIYPQARAAGDVMFTLYYPAGSAWEESLQQTLSAKHPMHDLRHYYEFDPPLAAWRERLHPGFRVRPVDTALLEEDHLEHVDQLREEIVSEGGTVADFLEHRFGSCSLHEDTIAGWCLSEFNWRDRCEVGIETVDGYRRQGVATTTAGALIELAEERGVHRIGWHCWADNEPSVATARRVGFRLVDEYPVLFAFFERTINLGVNGNQYMGRQEYGQALDWYEQALASSDEPPDWIAWNAACASARLGRTEQALAYLQRAFDLGFDDVEHLQNSPHLESVRGTEGWQALIREKTRSAEWKK